MFSINNIYARSHGDVHYGLPIKLTSLAFQEFPQDEQLLVGKYIAIDITAKFDCSVDEEGFTKFLLTDFDVTRFCSFDLEARIYMAFDNATQTHTPVNLNLPVLGFLAHKNDESIKADRGVAKWTHNDKIYDLILFGSCESPHLSFTEGPASSDYYVNTPYCHTLVWRNEGKSDALTPYNVRHIFKRFYAHVRGFGFNGEYKYGEAIYYSINKSGAIIHHFKEDKVSNSAYGTDHSSKKSTTVIRLGDGLTKEMKEYMAEPVKGHYKPRVLY
ncbi:hypothetical protein [Alteromonas sp. KUL106]|uniref:hypothetical protein n=1 Tax=Alteromonas sp. KUL106 TaxID=2480799 RepID=UPI0012E52E90|nr:hypothetical protein [Alteromonas sp. KUL106]GFD66771.1 hypothetical protein KUL106_00340 [Alteromonas sp. KUL106]